MAKGIRNKWQANADQATQQMNGYQYTLFLHKMAGDQQLKGTWAELWCEHVFGAKGLLLALLTSFRIRDLYA